jgi:ribonucleoside-triphosphate reductase
MKARMIQKRDGSIVEFESSKIADAIYKCFMACGQGDRSDAKKISDKVTKDVLRSGRMPTVEEVQDLVEMALMEDGKFRAAKAYILYREQHKTIREVTGILEDLGLVSSYITRKDWRVKENSNMTYSLQGLNCHVSSQVISRYWMEKIYTSQQRNLHLSGDIHIHDLGTLGAYCVGWDLQDLLLRGFTGVSGKVTSTPARHFKVALNQAVNYLYTLQGETAGAQAFSNFDSYLAPFIRFDGLDYKDVKQAVQEFIFNTNVPTRVGFQTPFTNITLDLEVPKFLENEPAICGGEAAENPYGDFQEEMNMFNRAFGEIMVQGDGAGNPFTFPIPTINITRDFDWGSDKYDAIWEMTSKYGIPYFSNFVNSDMEPDDVRSMCCRLRLDNRELRKRGGGLFGSNPLTGSIGVTTINMPRLGYVSRDESDFLERLDYLMDTCRDSLVTKREVLNNFTEEGLYPYSAFYLQSVKERFGTYWKNHFSTIGLVGMNECLMNFMGTDIGSPDGIDFAVKTLRHMRRRLSEFQDETGDMFNLEATPAEGATYRLAQLDKERYPDIIAANTDGGKPFYTNSTQLPVNYTDNVFEAFKLQDNLQTMYTGGTVLHVFLGDSYPPSESIKRLVNIITDNFKLPYFTVTPTFSVCPTHGYISGEHETCPRCTGRCEVYSRTVGYLRPISQWNDGKTSEFNHRKTFDLSLRPKKPEAAGERARGVETPHLVA